MGLLNQQRGANRPLSRSSSATSGARSTRPGLDTVLKRSSNLAGISSAVAKPQQVRGTARSLAKKKDSVCMAATLDLASQIGLSIEGRRTNINSETVVADIAAANARYLEQHADDNCNSDDELDESEQTQAQAMHKTLFEKLASVDKLLSEKWAKDEKRDYDANGQVLDQAVVEKRLDMVREFAEHLRRVGQNRATLLARLAEPMAEEHWVLDSAYHQQMVSAFQSMCALVNSLPEIAAAARHCVSPAVVNALSATEVMGDENNADLGRKARRIAQMERLVHKVEQIIIKEGLPEKQPKNR
ncbi:hypothetical protein H4R99_004388 [Coemansia sp. RSA 1722]|nr:hypothetical protein IWW45_005186 [Coemansia sp. RSA 485]KAJ2597731.1 hypothetical protein H4R99_004388 [Coemansia sp. RSA 1722]